MPLIMKNKYQILIVTFDGESYVTDFHKSNSIEEAWKQDLNSGSRWFFYPLHFVIVDYWKYPVCKESLFKQRIMGVPYFYNNLFEPLNGKTVNSLLKFIQGNKSKLDKLLIDDLNYIN